MSCKETTSPDPLLQARELEKHFPGRGGFLQATSPTVRAVDGVDLEIQEGETLGLVGESGCGKSTLGRTVIHLLEPTRGETRFQGRSLGQAGRQEIRDARRNMQIVFQDPFDSLNPRLTARRVVREGLDINRLYTRKQRETRVQQTLDRVGLSVDMADRYPHEFSGGQRQRLGVARALAMEPKLLVADEAVSALDVSIQAKILNLLVELKRELGLTYLFISHNLAVVSYISNRIGVMYLGKIVEVATTTELHRNPRHPYTMALLSAIPRTHPRQRTQRMLLPGDVPSATNPPGGCRFHTRCPYVQATRCHDEVPSLRTLSTGQQVACHWAEEIQAGNVRPQPTGGDTR